MYSVQRAAYLNQSHALPERYFSIIWFQSRSVWKKKTLQVTNVWIISLIMQNSHHETQASVSRLTACPLDPWSDVSVEFFLFFFCWGLMMTIVTVEIGQEKDNYSSVCGSDTSKGSFNLHFNGLKGTCLTLGQYWSMRLIYLLSSSFSWAHVFRRLTSPFEPHWQQCPCPCSLL